jgi:hypothetical protein
VNPATSPKRQTLAERAGRAARALSDTYSARRRKKTFFRRLRDDIVTLAIFFAVMWIAVNVIARLVN